MKIYDLSLTISSDLPTWPGDPRVILEQTASIDKGAHANVSRLDLGVHTGTHVDAPHHFLNDGRTVESLPLDVLTGPALVTRIADDVDVITREVLSKADIPQGTVRLLLKTRNSQYWLNHAKDFQTGFVGISDDGAAWLVQQNIRLIGVDYLSVALYQQSGPTHRTLLKSGVVIIEGLDLSGVSEGHYELFCLPLKLAGSDGAPARTILIGE